MDNAIEKYIYLKSDFMSSSECKWAVDQIETVDWQKHSYHRSATNDFESLDDDLYVNFGTPEVAELIMPRLWNCIKDYLDHYNLPWFTTWQGYLVPRFNKYPVGSHMTMHCDHIHTMFDGQRKGIPILTILGSLNNDYAGGELTLCDKEFELSAGSLVIFPSCFLYPHEIKHVTDGTRYSYVSWVW